MRWEQVASREFVRVGARFAEATNTVRYRFPLSFLFCFSSPHFASERGEDVRRAEGRRAHEKSRGRERT